MSQGPLTRYIGQMSTPPIPRCDTEAFLSWAFDDDDTPSDEDLVFYGHILNDIRRGECEKRGTECVVREFCEDIQASRDDKPVC